MANKKDLRTVIAEVKSAHDIFDVVVASGSTLKPSGPNKAKGLCPFHSEKTPSFTVDSSFQNYYCFGCKESGDAISYIQRTENLSFIEALKFLAEQKGISIDFDDDKQTVDYATLRKILKESAKFFIAHFKRLDKNHPAVSEVLDRGLDPTRMHYGYAPEKRDALFSYLKKKGFQPDQIVEAGVCLKSKSRESYFDFWSGRLMFIITDTNGNPIGFSGRKLFDEDKRGKYVNSSDNPLFDKSKALFNIYSARKPAGGEKKIYIVEGQFDVAAFRASNMKNVVASSGTAFSEIQARTCQRLVGDYGEVVFCFDGDKSGMDAAIRVFKENPLLHTNASVVFLPSNLDPCDFRLEYGGEKLQEYVSNNLKNLVDFAVDSLEENFDFSSSVERSKYVKTAIELVSHIKNRTMLEDQVRKIALNSLTSYEELLESSKKEAKDRSKNVKNRKISDASRENDSDEIVLASSDVEKNLIDSIEDSKILHTAAAFIALSIDNPSFTKAALRVRGTIPVEYDVFLKDLEEVHQKQLKLIPENFSQVSLAKNLMDTRHWFPRIDDMERDDKLSLLKHLKKSLDYSNKESREVQIRRKINEILQSSKGSNADRLRQALEIEKRELEK